ncbi:hypothetical protein H0H93_002090, partial [Arthromyces matolae]
TDMGLTSFMHNLLVELPNSRTQEYEADKIGLRLMSKACYDPKAAVEYVGQFGCLNALRRLKVEGESTSLQRIHQAPNV